MSLLSDISKKLQDKYLRLVLLVCLASFALNLVGIWWGLPEQWEPDESPRIALSMANHLDPNPHNFIAPTLHRYMVIASLAPYYAYLMASGEIKVIKANAHMDVVPDYFLTNVFLIARMISVVLGALTVYLIYLVGKNAKDQTAGLLSATFAAFTMGFVNISHFSTVDTTAIFWCALSLYFSALIIRSPDKKNYLLAGASAGLAISTKYTAGLLIISLVVAHLMSVKRTKIIDGKIILGLVMVLVFFVIGSPYAVLDYRTLIGAVQTHQAETLSDYKGISNPNPGYVSVFLNLIDAFGLPLFLIVVCGAVDAVYAIYRKKEGYRYDLFLFSWILPSILIIGDWNFSPMRYIMPGALFLTLFAGIFSTRMLDSLAGSKKVLFRWVLLFVILYSLAYSIMADIMFVADPRYQATMWLKENVKPGQTLDIYNKRYNPSIPDGINVTQPGSDGFDNQTAIDAFDKFIGDLQIRKPDYIVLSSLYYERYLVDPGAYPSRTAYFLDLLNEKGGYRIAAQFGPPVDGNDGANGFGSRMPFTDRVIDSIALRPHPEFLDPTIVILGRGG